MKRLPAALYALLAIAIAVWAIGRASARTGANEAATEIHERNRAIVARAYKAARDSIPATLAATDRQRGRVNTASAVSDASAHTLRLVLASARDALVDSTATAARLRAELAHTVAMADSVLAAHRAERVERIALDSLHAVERAVLLSALAQSDHLHAADRAVIAALKAERCTVVWRIPCPTRTQSALMGGVVAVALIATIR